MKIKLEHMVKKWNETFLKVKIKDIKYKEGMVIIQYENEIRN